MKGHLQWCRQGDGTCKEVTRTSNNGKLLLPLGPKDQGGNVQAGAGAKERGAEQDLLWERDRVSSRTFC
jgi:hypothetical protein